MVSNENNIKSSIEKKELNKKELIEDAEFEEISEDPQPVDQEDFLM